MQSTHLLAHQELPACFHKYLVKFTIERLSLRVPHLSTINVSLRIGNSHLIAGNEEVYGRRKVRLEDGQCEVHEKLQLLSTLRYNKLSGHHENIRVKNKSLVRQYCPSTPFRSPARA